MLLPPSLLLTLFALSTNAQTRTPLPLNQVALFSSQTSFSVPTQTQGELAITVALCSISSPRFFISNSTGSLFAEDPGPDGGEDNYEIFLQDGFGNWTGLFPGGGILAVEGLPPGASFEVGVSTSGPLHDILSDYPLFGDSTNNQAIVFSPMLAPAPPPDTPIYPNYTLPSANSSLPSPPTSIPNVTLIVSQTTDKPLLRTSCFLNSSTISTTGTTVNSSLWLRGLEDGWRTEWLLGGLTPQTNYTAFVVQDTHKVSGPLYFVTKPASFQCTLVHALPFCPSIAYALPLPLPSSTSTINFPIYDSSNLPQQLSSQVINTLTNFTISLSTFACGRDWYSPLLGCDACQREYRKWLCTVLFPRCSEPSQSNPQFITPNPGQVGTVNAGPSSNQAVLSALLPMPSQPTSNNDSNSPYITGYTRLLPCIEVCNAVDRACPPFLGFQCPTRKFNGAATYGFGYIDGADGQEAGGLVKSAQDRWGNVWCNGG
ncbi:Calcium influx-promoting protein ehs1 [Leucoagaricus sp. SymC.cos]|nr:Calcium influx-promoting protein ehs1 [Leucoagaricus sp. SymC.cos]